MYKEKNTFFPADLGGIKFVFFRVAISTAGRTFTAHFGNLFPLPHEQPFFSSGTGGSDRAVYCATEVSRPAEKRADLFAVAEALLSCCFNPLSVEMLYYNFTEIHPTSVKSAGGCHYDTPPCVQCSMFKERIKK